MVSRGSRPDEAAPHPTSGPTPTLVGRIPSRQSRTPTKRSEDERRFYQERLTLMYRVGFGLSAVFALGVIVVRGLVEGNVLAELTSPSRWFHLGATALLGIHAFMLARTTRSYQALVWIDVIGVLVLATLLDLNGGLFHVRSVAVFNLALTTGLIAVLRAVLVPSTWQRTLLLGVVTSAMAVAMFFMTLHPLWPVQQRLPGVDWSVSQQLISLVLWLFALVTTATVASRIIYDLRHEVHAARKLGQYILHDKIGEGGMGVVYRATHAMLRRETALKLLRPNHIDEETLRRFEREVVQTARLSHPNTVAIYDYGRTPEGVFYYAMEYLDGVTIGELVEEVGALPPGRVVHLLAQVCASLEEAHAAGLVHRDIKPANVMITGRDGACDLVKVLDFGLVKQLHPAKGSLALTNRSELTGTPMYMSPEAIKEPDKIGPCSDLYAVAAVGFFMLTGTHLFERDSVIEVCAAQLHEPPDRPSTRLGQPLPPDLEEVILKSLAKEPEDRHADARAFRLALLAVDVPRWTEEDARAWWSNRPRRSGVHGTSKEASLATAATERIRLGVQPYSK